MLVLGIKRKGDTEMKYFTMENTEGFTQEELDNMNILANERISDETNNEEIQSVCERILKEA